jgi:glycosyltransferase involved in cell wall biosynthesis
MKVLFTSPATFGPEGVYGGGERYALELARAVAGQVGSATLFAAGRSNVEWRDGSLRVVVRRPWTSVRGQVFNPLPRGLPRLLREADVVHCFQRHIVMSSLALALGRISRRPTYVTEMGGGGWDVSAYLDTRRWCTGMLHLSRYAAKLEGRDGHPADAVLYGGAHGREDPCGGGDEILFVGRLLPHKGPDVLVEAVEPSWPVTLCGSGLDEPYTADLRSLADGKRVRFEMTPSDDQLEGAYRRAAVVVVPSVRRDRYGNETPVAELLGLVAIEAGARGIPVVASDLASLPEIVRDGVTGLLVPPGDRAALRARLAELLANPSLRRRLGDAAREEVRRHFTWGCAAEVAASAYRRGLEALRRS